MKVRVKLERIEDFFVMEVQTEHYLLRKRYQSMEDAAEEGLAAGLIPANRASLLKNEHANWRFGLGYTGEAEVDPTDLKKRGFHLFGASV